MTGVYKSWLYGNWAPFPPPLLRYPYLMFCLFRDWVFSFLIAACLFDGAGVLGTDTRTYHGFLDLILTQRVSNLTLWIILLPYRDFALGKVSYSPFVLLLQIWLCLSCPAFLAVSSLLSYNSRQ